MPAFCEKSDKVKRMENTLKVLHALLEVVEECPEGAPAGVMYAALMGAISLDQFEQFMGVLVQAGRVRRQGHVYYPTSAALPRLNS